jgi:hypothetical protein
MMSGANLGKAVVKVAAEEPFPVRSGGDHKAA